MPAAAVRRLELKQVRGASPVGSLPELQVLTQLDRILGVEAEAARLRKSEAGSEDYGQTIRRFNNQSLRDE